MFLGHRHTHQPCPSDFLSLFQFPSCSHLIDWRTDACNNSKFSNFFHIPNTRSKVVIVPLRRMLGEICILSWSHLQDMTRTGIEIEISTASLSPAFYFSLPRFFFLSGLSVSSSSSSSSSVFRLYIFTLHSGQTTCSCPLCSQRWTMGVSLCLTMTHGLCSGITFVWV